MILGIGTDLASAEMIKNELNKSYSAFLESVFTKAEIDISKNGAVPVHERLAGRYAAKEAFIKASGLLFLGTSIRFSLNQIEIINKSNGLPEFNLHPDIQKAMDLAEVKTIWLSISHENNFGLATVIFEGADRK